MEKIDLLFILCMASFIFNIYLLIRLKRCEVLYDINTNVVNTISRVLAMAASFNAIVCEDLDALGKATGVKVKVMSASPSPTGGREAEAEHKTNNK